MVEAPAAGAGAGDSAVDDDRTYLDAVGWNLDGSRLLRPPRPVKDGPDACC